jgi:hypothetical protein
MQLKRFDYVGQKHGLEGLRSFAYPFYLRCFVILKFGWGACIVYATLILGAWWEELGLHTGDPLEAKVEAGRIVLARPSVRMPGAGIVVDPRTGIPVLSGGEDSPRLTSDMVAGILADFS